MIDYEEFARVWNESDTVTEVAEFFDITKEAARSRRASAKKKGYELKRFKRKPLADKEFIEAYSASSSDAEVAAMTGLTLGSIRVRKFLVREKGILLPSRHRGSLHPAYVAALLDRGAHIQRRDRRTFIAYQLRITMPDDVAAEFVSQFADFKIESVNNGIVAACYNQNGIRKCLGYAIKHLRTQKSVAQSTLKEMK